MVCIFFISFVYANMTMAFSLFLEISHQLEQPFAPFLLNHCDPELCHPSCHALHLFPLTDHAAGND